MITLLDQNTINKIAAGEVIERPSAVVKELVENSIDAGANGITIEIKDGGIRFIRITDNGWGIKADELALAFKRHSTSKIKSVEDLMTVKSLGFRGEALSSIAAVSQTEVVTKTEGALTGARYIIEGGEEKEIEEIGCPEGTTFIVRNLFFNTPARRKFLKSSMTEAGYVADLVERLSISHPDVAFKFINNNQVKLQTSGNNNLKDIIYHVYGRDIASQIVNVEGREESVQITGFAGKPVISRGNRNYMNYFINGRYIKSAIISRAIEEAYKPYTMSHRYPFVILSFDIASGLIDVNVHPTKMEVRFSNQEDIFRLTYEAVSQSLKGKEMIVEVSLNREEKKKNTIPKNEASFRGPEPFEKKRLEQKEKDDREKDRKNTNAVLEELNYHTPSAAKEIAGESVFVNPAESLRKKENAALSSFVKEVNEEAVPAETQKPVQLDLFSHTGEEGFLKKENQKEHHIIGQLFSTYWLIEYRDKLFIIDQHAAHEKVLYERMMEGLSKKEVLSQMMSPPLVLTLNMREEEVLKTHMELFKRLGFEIEPFGGKEYALCGVPANLYSIAQKELMLELIDSLAAEDGKHTPSLLLEKIASMSCKAAVKGNMNLSIEEASGLIDELMTLENPYHCPHGRPTIVAMSKYEIEKKFKRII